MSSKWNSNGSNFLKFVRVDRPDKKTPEFEVRAEFSNVTLGWIKWYPGWRRMCFFPSPGTLYDALCLQHISNQVQKVDSEYKANRASKKLAAYESGGGR